jgi:predicted DNA-binding antitoxin AbrB/MazE fold protein
MGLEIETTYEKGVLKLPRELPLQEGTSVRITIHPPGITGGEGFSANSLVDESGIDCPANSKVRRQLQESVMSRRSRIEKEIEELLLRENLEVGTLHNRLFAQGGLFHQLAPTKAQRQCQRETALYKRAKSRVSELMLAAQRQLKQRVLKSNLHKTGARERGPG